MLAHPHSRGTQRMVLAALFLTGGMVLGITLAGTLQEAAPRPAVLGDIQDEKPHKCGLRIFMDVLIVNNDGALFAAPTMPGKVLDGVELKGKTIPDYLQFLQQPDLKNPGFVAHMTYKFGKAFEIPDRIVLTNLGAQIDQWNLAVQQAGGDPAMAVF